MVFVMDVLLPIGIFLEGPVGYLGHDHTDTSIGDVMVLVEWTPRQFNWTAVIILPPT